MTHVELIALFGWLLALFQFVITHLEGRRKNYEDLLEKTLGYFERGTQARTIGISLVDAIWYKRKQYLDVIVPVLVSQINFLLSDADNYGQEERNLIRLFILVEKCLPYAAEPHHETAEVSEAILSAARNPGKIVLSKGTLKIWFAKFNNGDSEMFEAETESS